jgi:hypothetical protein
MPRPEQPFASFEQTLPGPMMMTTLWPLADVPKKMTPVHGSLYSRCSSLEAKRQLRFEAFLPPPHRLPFVVTLRNVPFPRSSQGEVARAKARFCPAFNALPTA